MTEFGYTAMCEQTPVCQLVSDLVAAEEAGFDFSVMSDHYFPWIEEQGHSGYAWSVLGAAAQATSRLPLMTLWRRKLPPWGFCRAAGSRWAWAQASGSTNT
jgi:alkanesulfonate monooxygenase SsuD/methylene tetrahydromethanopterin reductase-like flavin-dependent oxidoreductase (luciferase family)